MLKRSKVHLIWFLFCCFLVLFLITRRSGQFFGKKIVLSLEKSSPQYIGLFSFNFCEEIVIRGNRDYFTVIFGFQPVLDVIWLFKALYMCLCICMYMFIFIKRFGILELRSRVTKPSYAKWQNDVTLRVTNSKSKNKKFHFELLTRSWKKKLHFDLLTRGFNFYILTFELLTRSWKIKNHTSSY